MIIVDNEHVIYNGGASDVTSSASIMEPEVVSLDNQLFYMFLGGVDRNEKDDTTKQRVVLLNKHGVWFFAIVHWEMRSLRQRVVAPKNKLFFLANNEGEIASVRSSLIMAAIEHHGWTVKQAHEEVGKTAPQYVNRCFAISDLVRKLKACTDDHVHYAFD